MKKTYVTKMPNQIVLLEFEVYEGGHGQRKAYSPHDTKKN